MTKRSFEEEGTAFFPTGSDVLARSRLARYFAKLDCTELALAICSRALAQRGGRAASTEQIHIPWPFKIYETGGYANGRTDFSRSNCRVFAAAINVSLSLVSTTPASCLPFAIFKSSWPPL